MSSFVFDTRQPLAEAPAKGVEVRSAFSPAEAHALLQEIHKAEGPRSSRFDEQGEVRLVNREGSGLAVFDITQGSGRTVVLNVNEREITGSGRDGKQLEGGPALEAFNAALLRWSRGALESPETTRAKAAELASACFEMATESGGSRPVFTSTVHPTAGTPEAYHDAELLQYALSRVDSHGNLEAQVPGYIDPAAVHGEISELMGPLKYVPRRSSERPSEIVCIFQEKGGSSRDWIVELRPDSVDSLVLPRVVVSPGGEVRYISESGQVDERPNTARALITLAEWLETWKRGKPIPDYDREV
jgi:hypothetical protein